MATEEETNKTVECEDLARTRQTLMAMDALIEELSSITAASSTDQQGAAMIEKLASARAALATEREKKNPRLAGVDHMPCRRHLRERPVEDPNKAAALHGIKALLKEDLASCYICVARDAALNRIEAAGGDSVKAAEDSESRLHGEVCVMKRVGATANAAAEAEGKARPVGVTKKTMKVRSTYLRHLLTADPLRPLYTLPEDYFEEEENPDHHREAMVALALSKLSNIDETDNILRQFLEKGYAMMELQVDYGNQ